jgi:hypothetical protein
MLRWAAAARLGHGVFTSNVDGHFLRAGACVAVHASRA